MTKSIPSVRWKHVAAAVRLTLAFGALDFRRRYLASLRSAERVADAGN